MAQETTKQKDKKEAKPKKRWIYLGPDVAGEDLHLTYGMIFLGKPKLPKDAGFLEEWFFEIGEAKDLAKKRREIKTPGTEIYKKWQAARKKAHEFMRKRKK